MPTVAIAILAAGFSSRMGRSKQLLIYEGKSFIQHAVDKAAATGCAPIFLIVSYEQADLIRQQTSLPGHVRLVTNSNSVEGIASSIRVGVDAAMGTETIDALMFMNCDQPDLTEIGLSTLIKLYERGKIVAAKFDGVIGSPAIFDRVFFSELSSLRGDTGAKSVIKAHEKFVLLCDLSEAGFDVDSPRDFETLLKRQST